MSQQKRPSVSHNAKRVILIILDGVGVGALPDAVNFGDAGVDTLGHVAKQVGGLKLPNLESLGLGNIHSIAGVKQMNQPKGCFGKMNEMNAGKDSTAGHWEICGIVLKEPFRTFPNGFSSEIIEQFCRRANLKGIYGNKAASGTGIIDEFGAAHLKTGWPIIYTSADSVFQIAAHQEVLSVNQLYRLCEIAFATVVPIGVGRVIARPFIGKPGAFERTEFRKDFSVSPPPGTLLDHLCEKGITVLGVGKVDNLFDGRGFHECQHTKDNQHGVDQILNYLKKSRMSEGETMIFANLVDFDTMYGHRNDPQGFARALESLDVRLPEIIQILEENDLLIITADHGNDPTHPGSDHTREYVPVLATTKNLYIQQKGIDLGIRTTYADIAATIADFFRCKTLENGRSFLKSIIN
jgi:phosphopentomutase